MIGENGLVPAAHEGQDVEVVLDTTPFYAEGGGQLADWGVITDLGSGAELAVVDVQQPLPGLIVHRATVLSGEVPVPQRTNRTSGRSRCSRPAARVKV